MSNAPIGDRPVHLHLPYLGLALIGGTLGTAAREAIALAFPSTSGIPWAIFAVNILGAFLLGLLLEALAQTGPDGGRRRRLRILVGTGFMGGFTTYSALSTATANLLGAGDVGTGIAYGLGTVIIGGLAAWAGIVVATVRQHRSHSAPVQQTDDAARYGGTE